MISSAAHYSNSLFEPQTRTQAFSLLVIENNQASVGCDKSQPYQFGYTGRLYLKMSVRGIILAGHGLRRHRERIYKGEGILKLFFGLFE